jgi:hypothetical protein
MQYNDIFLFDDDTKLYTGRYIKKNDKSIKPWKKRVLGWDPGYRVDCAGISVIDYCHDGIYRVIAADEWHNIKYTQQRKDIDKIVHDLEIDTFVFDANGPGNTFEDDFKELHDDGIPRYPSVYDIRRNLIPIYSHTKEFKYSMYISLKKLMTEGRFRLIKGNQKLEDSFAALKLNTNKSITHKKTDSIDLATSVMLAMTVFLNPKYNKKGGNLRISTI